MSFASASVLSLMKWYVFLMIRSCRQQLLILSQTSEKEVMEKELGKSVNASEDVIYKIDVPANRYIVTSWQHDCCTVV